MTEAVGSLTVGVDIGGTKVEATLVDTEGRVIASCRRDSGAHLEVAAIVSELARCVDELREQAGGREIGAAGMGVAGQIDPDSGVVLDSPNLRWHMVPIRELVQEALGMPVTVTNDVRAVTWGEWKCGAGKGVSDLLCVFVGTGIGGGVITGGRLLTGSTGVAGEVGHTVIDPNGPPCRCGSQGCLEAHAGGWAIGLRAQQAVEAEPEAGSVLMALAQGDSSAITAAMVSQAAHADDTLALRLVAETGEALGAGVASLVNLFNPRLVILGGGVIEGLPELIGTVVEGVQARALPSHRAEVDVVGAKLGRYSGTVGAALMARERLTG